MIEPKEWKIINGVLEYIEYKINSITNYVNNSEYPEAKKELSKAFYSLRYLQDIARN